MKSGIEMLEEINRKLEQMDRRFIVIEQNMKEVLNRANMLAKPKPAESKLQVNKPMITATVPTPTPDPAPAPKPTNMAKAIGRIMNQDGRMVSGVRVRIYNEKNQMVKQTKTNRAGEWMSFLPPGNYGAEYFLKDIINANVSFSINDGEKIIRVAQP